MEKKTQTRIVILVTVCVLLLVATLCTIGLFFSGLLDKKVVNRTSTVDPTVRGVVQKIPTCVSENRYTITKRGTVEECKHLGDYADWCRIDGTGKHDCQDCDEKDIREDLCPIMCGYCTPPRIQDSETCDANEKCHESEKGCFYVGQQGSDEECMALGDLSTCKGSKRYNCLSCNKEHIGNNTCPYMCGYCKAPPAENNTTCEENPACTVTSAGCFYYGKQGSTRQCRISGADMDGSDDAQCDSSGDKRYGCGTCNAVINGRSVKKYYCPIMCGYCPPRPVADDPASAAGPPPVMDVPSDTAKLHNSLRAALAAHNAKAARTSHPVSNNSATAAPTTAAPDDAGSQTTTAPNATVPDPTDAAHNASNATISDSTHAP